MLRGRGLASAARRTIEAARRARGRARRTPPGSRLVPRPSRRGRGQAPLRLSHALLACDLNSRYLAFWPLARRAWRDIVGLEPVLVLVAEPAEVPPALAADEAVAVFPPVEGVHTAFQAQAIRLLYPALVEADGAIVTSDADMLPLTRRYFERPAAQVPARDFLAYRDLHPDLREIPICYNAALPATWGSIFDVGSEEDVRERLRSWGEGLDYAGVAGGAGWVTDQRILWSALTAYGRRTRSVWILDDDYTGFRRLERTPVRQGLDARERHRIRRGFYSDFHGLHPYEEFREQNELVLDLAADARG